LFPDVDAASATLDIAAAEKALFALPEGRIRDETDSTAPVFAVTIAGGRTTEKSTLTAALPRRRWRRLRGANPAR